MGPKIEKQPRQVRLTIKNLNEHTNWYIGLSRTKKKCKYKCVNPIKHLIR